MIHIYGSWCNSCKDEARAIYQSGKLTCLKCKTSKKVEQGKKRVQVVPTGYDVKEQQQIKLF